MKLIANVSKTERILAGALAGWIILGFLRGRKPSARSVLFLGGLIYRAGTGNCKGYEMLGICNR